MHTSLAGIKSIPNAEIYNPGTNSWSAIANMAVGRSAHTANLMLPGGRVIVAGGTSGSILTPVSVAGVQEFNPATNAWRSLKNLQAARAGHGAAVTADGLLVIFGGAGGPNNLSLDTIESVHQ